MLQRELKMQLLELTTSHPFTIIEDRCGICRDDESTENIFLITTCDHLFHKNCLLPWLEQQGTCPMCRKIIVVPSPLGRVLCSAAFQGFEVSKEISWVFAGMVSIFAFSFVANVELQHYWRQTSDRMVAIALTLYGFGPCTIGAYALPVVLIPGVLTGMYHLGRYYVAPKAREVKFRATA